MEQNAGKGGSHYMEGGRVGVPWETPQRDPEGVLHHWGAGQDTVGAKIIARVA